MTTKLPAFGTLAWAERRSGRMTLRERAAELARGLQVVADGLPDELRRRLGFRNPRAYAFDPERVRVPDSKIAREADECVRDASAPWMVDHSLRTWLYASALGAADGVRYDGELLYVAALLHDLTMTERWRDYAPTPCFAARGGLLARDWARERGWPEPRCTTLGDAVSLHLNAKVPAVHGPEAQLLQAGAAFDMIGLRRWDLAPASVDAVLARHPRGPLKRVGLAGFAAECRPGTRASLLRRGLGFMVLARHTSFED